MKTRVLELAVRADEGGGSTYIQILLESMDSDQFEFFVACPDEKPYTARWRDLPNVMEVFSQIPKQKFSFSIFLKLIKFCKKNKIDIIHANGKGAGLYGRLLKLFIPKAKVIFTLHGLHIMGYSIFKKKIYLGYERLLSRLTDCLIHVSHGERTQCEDLKVFKCDKKVIYNGTEENEYERITPEKFTIASISRFDFQKNMELSYQIAKRCPDFQFIWLGDGEDKAGLEKRAEEESVANIKFVGFVDNSLIKKYLSQSSVYLTSSRWEGLPFALVEACSAGLPIVATDVVGNNEVCTHEVNGYVFNTVDEAVDYLKRLSTNSEAYQNLSEASISTFKENFTLDIMLREHRQLFLSVLK